MLKHISVILLLMVSLQIFASDENNKWKLKPTPSEVSEDAVFIPENLEGAFKELNLMLTSELIAEMKNGSEGDMIQYHHSLGQWIRNNWELWGGSRLSKHFNSMGINHPDDMSGIILNSYWRKLNDKPIKLDEQVKFYQEYWADTEEGGE